MLEKLHDHIHEQRFRLCFPVYISCILFHVRNRSLAGLVPIRAFEGVPGRVPALRSGYPAEGSKRDQ